MSFPVPDAATWAAVAACAALLAALVNLIHTRRAARVHAAHLYVEFARRYNAPETSDALNALADWRRRNGDSFAAVFQKKLLAKEPDAVRIDHHRRLLDAYFLDVARAYQAGVLDKTFARLAADHPGAAVWRQVVVPMNTVTHQDAKADRHLKVLRRVKRKLGDGEMH